MSIVVCAIISGDLFVILLILILRWYIILGDPHFSARHYCNGMYLRYTSWYPAFGKLTRQSMDYNMVRVVGNLQLSVS